MQVTIQEAAHRLGIAESTVRRRLRNGELEGSQMPTPQGFTWLVDLPDTPPSENSSPPSGEVTALRELVEVLHSQAQGLEEQLSAKDRQIEQLHVLLRQAQAALPAPRARRRWWWGR